jgi:hypothetical protein
MINAGELLPRDLLGFVIDNEDKIFLGNDDDTHADTTPTPHASSWTNTSHANDTRTNA